MTQVTLPQSARTSAEERGAKLNLTICVHLRSYKHQDLYSYHVGCLGAHGMSEYALSWSEMCEYRRFWSFCSMRTGRQDKGPSGGRRTRGRVPCPRRARDILEPSPPQLIDQASRGKSDRAAWDARPAFQLVHAGEAEEASAPSISRSAKEENKPRQQQKIRQSAPGMVPSHGPQGQQPNVVI